MHSSLDYASPVSRTGDGRHGGSMNATFRALRCSDLKVEIKAACGSSGDLDHKSAPGF
jgi:hypothetical protein